MNLKEKLIELKPFIGVDKKEFERRFKEIKENCKTSSDIKLVDEFIRKGLCELTTDLREFTNDVTLKIKLQDVTDIISVSYISQHYFGRSRQWFYQRLNGNVVNGKEAVFTEEELQKLDFALKDISNKIGSVSVF